MLGGLSAQKLSRAQMSKVNTVVIFHYFEKSDEHKDNLTYFLRRGYRTDVDYIICIAGGCGVPLPQARNISYHYIPNGRLDYSGFAHVVNGILNAEKYDYFIFLNSSVRGPFLPSYFDRPWPRVFTDLIDDQTKLVGSTINILGKDHRCSRFSEHLNGSRKSLSHVQSMAYAMDRTALQHLIEKGFYQNDFALDNAMVRAWIKADVERRAMLPRLYWSLRHRVDYKLRPGRIAERAEKLSTILNYEILLSQTIIANGWNITCLLPEYRRIDYREPHQEINPSSADGDPCFRGAYCGRSIHPFETVFIKTSRNNVDLAYLKSLEASQTEWLGGDASAYHASAFEVVLCDIPSAWKGHSNFATWLVTKLEPSVVVDLGVDFGFSTFCFARPGIGQVVGVDSFEGDIHSGKRETFTAVRKTASQLGLSNVTLIRGLFGEVAKTWDKEIGILHIDGTHTYAAAKRDYEDWSNFVASDGVVLLHDTCVEDFGVRRLFNEIRLPKTNFAHSYGLGVISKSKSLISEIAATFSSLIEPGTTALKP